MSKPDSACASSFTASPNHEPRVGSLVDIIVLHYTGMQGAEAAQARLCNPDAKVSSHYLIGEDGGVTQLVAEARRAYHAGAASWQGESDINSRSIGIEIVNGGHDFGLPDFPPRQIEAVIRLCRDVQSRWPIPQYNVLAHSDVAPARKQDPGEKFPWDTLYNAGVGLWVIPAPPAGRDALKPGDNGASVLQLKSQLSNYGYGINATALFDQETQAVVTAFQRHFRPQRIDGIADASTRDTLTRLLEARRAAS